MAPAGVVFRGVGPLDCASRRVEVVLNRDFGVCAKRLLGGCARRDVEMIDGLCSWGRDGDARLLHLTHWKTHVPAERRRDISQRI